VPWIEARRAAITAHLSALGFRAGRDRPARLTDGEPVRAFVALNFPDQLRHELWDALAPLRERPEKLPVKWVAREHSFESQISGRCGGHAGAGAPEALQRAAGTGPEPRPLTLQITDSVCSRTITGARTVGGCHARSRARAAAAWCGAGVRAARFSTEAALSAARDAGARCRDARPRDFKASRRCSRERISTNSHRRRGGLDAKHPQT